MEKELQKIFEFSSLKHTHSIFRNDNEFYEKDVLNNITRKYTHLNDENKEIIYNIDMNENLKNYIYSILDNKDYNITLLKIRSEEFNSITINTSFDRYASVFNSLNINMNISDVYDHISIILNFNGEIQQVHVGKMIDRSKEVGENVKKMLKLTNKNKFYIVFIMNANNEIESIIID